jgi:hypothetical protein
MKRFFLLFAALCCFISHAQKDSRDSAEIAKNKKYYKYLGIQANLLLQQFISFNSNSSINTNPYVFSYSKNNIITGRGTVFGTGFNVSENSSNDGVTSVSVQNANITMRYGFERKYFQKEKLIPFWGIEFGAGFVSNKTHSRLIQSTTNTEVTVETQKIFAGPAFRGGLNYALSKHILIGTEFFFNCQISETQVNNGSGGGFNQTFSPFNIGFQAPTAFFLIFRY